MSIAVEHDKRKREILEKSLDVFIEEGYEDTTFQKIAERCGITRTILYLYFKNKREIFTFSIKLFLEKLENAIRSIAANEELPQAEKLAEIATLIMVQCSHNSRLLMVVIDYLGHIRATGGNPDESVKRRTIRMRHIIAGVVVRGQRSGEFRACSVKVVDDLIFSLVESAIFRLSVLGRVDITAVIDSARLFIQGLKSVGEFAPEHAAVLTASTR